METNFIHFIALFKESIDNQSFVKLTLSNNKSNEVELKNIYVKIVQIKSENKLSFTYRYKTKDIVKNYQIAEGVSQIQEYINVNYFTIVNLLTSQVNIQFELKENGVEKITKTKSTHQKAINESHNQQKNRIIDANSPYLHQLNITDVNGLVYKNTQDKYKQINHYIELLAPLLSQIPVKVTLNIVDMGSGKGYLTFALYDYLVQNLKIKTEATGVEFRADLVELCNKIAQNVGFEKLHFTQGSILDYEGEPDILIALHACDTATDDAIYKGIKANASLIVVAPCCHKQIRKEIEKNKAKNPLDFLTKHGIFLERQAEMVTDGLRALILEYFGYTVKIQQFISDAHTPKNVMITAVRKQNIELNSEKRKLEIMTKIQNIKTFFGIKSVYLSDILEI